MIGGAFGICIGGGAAVIALFPSIALWTSPIVCRSPYELAYKTTRYSYKPGQPGTSIGFWCLSDAGSFQVSSLTLIALQSLLIALVLAVIAAVVILIRRQVRRRR